MPGYRPIMKKKNPYKEDTMMQQSGIKPAPEMKQMAKDMAKKDKSKK